jgi:hypothetical protein
MDTETKKHFNKVELLRNYIEGGSLWNVMAQVCEAMGCYIFCNNEGKPEIKFNGGR